MFGGRGFQQTVGISMGTNCAPFVDDLHLRSYEAGLFGGIRVAHPFSFLCCLDFVFVFVLFLVCLMLSVSLDYPFCIASSVLSSVYSVFLHLPNVARVSGLTNLYCPFGFV